MADEQRVLDLDELFGQARAVKVKWQGKEYELLRMEAIGPRQAVEFERLQARAARLYSSDTANGNGATDQDAADLEALIDGMLKILSEELPIGDMAFGVKLRIVQFYAEETQGKKKVEGALKKVRRTGAKRSRG